MDSSITPVNGVYPPVQHSTNIPNTGSFVAALNGIMNTVFAYGGANIFTNFMAEMKASSRFPQGDVDFSILHLVSFLSSSTDIFRNHCLSLVTGLYICSTDSSCTGTKVNILSAPVHKQSAPTGLLS